MPKLLHGTIEKNKLKIERAALQLFTRKGFHGTTVREIANRAGISMGKLYIYYDTKKTSSSTWFTTWAARWKSFARRNSFP